MSGYGKRDAARDTDATPREVSRAWHDARDAAGVRQGGAGDRPTPQNRAEAAAKLRATIERGREQRERERRDRERGGR